MAAEAVALRVLDLAAEKRGRHLVGLVAHHQVPIGGGEFGLNVLVPAQLIEAADDQRVLREPVASAGGLELVVGQNVERKAPYCFVALAIWPDSVSQL